MNPATLAAIANAIQVASSAIQIGIQLEKTYEDLKPELDLLIKMVRDRQSLTEAETAQLMARHALLTEAALRPLGPRPVDAV